MLREVLIQAWSALRRQPLRSFLTMLGIVWGIVAVTLLIAYGSSFRSVMVDAFEAFGRDAVICWPGQTSEQALITIMKTGMIRNMSDTAKTSRPGSIGIAVLERLSTPARCAEVECMGAWRELHHPVIRSLPSLLCSFP